jgi:hypothetical protein
MVVEFAVIAGSSAAGAISAALVSKVSRLKAKAAKAPKSVNAARVELASLLFEKTLAAEAITRIYEASQDGRVDRLERDRLLLKYKQDLDSLNEKIAVLQPVADYADLKEVRTQLVSLIQDRISAIDAKLAEMSSAKPIVVERVQVMPTPEKIVDDTEKKQFKAEEKSIEQLQGEIMQALTRLEQVELDKD